MERETKQIAGTTWHRVGEISVDSGQVLISDPCYLRHGCIDEKFGEICDTSMESDIGGQVVHGLAYSSPTLTGDGSYSVWAVIDRNLGRPQGLFVDFCGMFSGSDDLPRRDTPTTEVERWKRSAEFWRGHATYLRDRVDYFRRLAEQRRGSSEAHNPAVGHGATRDGI